MRMNLVQLDADFQLLVWLLSIGISNRQSAMTDPTLPRFGMTSFHVIASA